MNDSCITWKYICDEMDNRFGIDPKSDEKFSFGEIERYLEAIWEDYVDKVDQLNI